MGSRFLTLACLAVVLGPFCGGFDAALGQQPNTTQITLSTEKGGTTTATVPIVDDSGSSTIVRAPDGTTVALDKDGNVIGEAVRNTGKDKDRTKWNIIKLKWPAWFLGMTPNMKIPVIPACYPDQAAKDAMVKELEQLDEKIANAIYAARDPVKGLDQSIPANHQLMVNAEAAYAAISKGERTPVCTPSTTPSTTAPPPKTSPPAPTGPTEGGTTPATPPKTSPPPSSGTTPGGTTPQTPGSSKPPSTPPTTPPPAPPGGEKKEPGGAPNPPGAPAANLVPHISLNLAGGMDYYYMPHVSSVFDGSQNAVGHSPGNLIGEGFNGRVDVPLGWPLLPGGRMPRIEMGFGYDQARRTTDTPLPFTIDAFAINGTNFATSFGGSSQASMSSELSMVQFRGDLMIAEKYRICHMPLKVETGFGYSRWEQDHNFVPFVQNNPSNAFRMSDSVDTDLYHFKTGITAYQHVGDGFHFLEGFNVGLGLAHSSLTGTQMLNNNDFTQSGSRNAFSANLGVKLGFDYRLTQGLRFGFDASYNYTSELPRVIYPSTTSGAPLHLQSESAQNVFLGLKLQWRLDD